MPKFLEKKLKKEYGAESDIPYKVMNKMGVMNGNKEIAKEMQIASSSSFLDTRPSSYAA